MIDVHYGTYIIPLGVQVALNFSKMGKELFLDYLQDFMTHK